ncbi:MAG TPA: hypothetical protein VGA82_04675 [Dehalococcoidales bacterium]
MIQRVHEHIITELQQNTRTDTIFVMTAIVLNLLSLGVNSGVASAAATSDSKTTATIVMFTFVALVIVVNLVAIVGLLRGKQSRSKLIGGLLKMYQDQGVAGYYDASLLSNYNTRYNLFILATIFTGAVALVIPFVLFVTL